MGRTLEVGVVTPGLNRPVHALVQAAEVLVAQQRAVAVIDTGNALKKNFFKIQKALLLFGSERSLRSANVVSLLVCLSVRIMLYSSQATPKHPPSTLQAPSKEESNNSQGSGVI